MGRKNRKAKAVKPVPAAPTVSELRIEYERAVKAVNGGNHLLGLSILKDAEPRLSSLPLFGRAVADVNMDVAVCATTGSLKSDYDNDAIKNFVDIAVDAAHKAAELSPSSIELAHFNAMILCTRTHFYGLECKRIIKECDRGLEIENPTDPALDVLWSAQTDPELATVEARVANVKQKLKGLIDWATKAQEETKGQSAAATGMQLGDEATGQGAKQDAAIDRPDEIEKPTKATEERRKEIEARVAAARLLQMKSTASGIMMKDDAVSSPESWPPKSDAANKLIERRKMLELRKFMASFEKKKRVESFWNSMSNNEKQGFFTVSITEMKAHYKKDSLAGNVVLEALAFVQANKVWAFRQCGQCKEKFVDCEAFMDHVVVEHVDRDWAKREEVLPQEASNDWVEMVLGSNWGPLDASAAMQLLIKGQSADGSDGGREDGCSSECLDSKDSSNPSHSSPQQGNDHLYQTLPVDDPQRSKLLGKIQSLLRVLIKHKYFTTRHVEKIMGFAMGVLPQVARMSLYFEWTKTQLQNPSLMCFLGSQDLDIILRKLELISVACELGKSPEEDGSWDTATLEENNMIPDDDGELGKIPYDDVLACDSSSIFLDSRFVPAMLGLTTAVEMPEQSVPEAGVLVDWLFSASTGEEQVLSWTRLREEKAQAFMQILKSLQIEHYHLLYWCEKKIQWSSYEVALCNMRNLFEQDTCNSDFVQSVPQSCKTIPKKSREELVEENDMSIISCRLELDVISVVLQDARATSVSQYGVHDTLSADLESGEGDDYRKREYVYLVDDHIKAAIVKKVARADVELDIIDARIKKCLAKLQLLKCKINSISAFSYGAAVVLLIKSLLQIHLEALVERDAKEKSDAASRAILEELDHDPRGNVSSSKGGDRSSKPKGKPKNKKKNKGDRKAKEAKVVAHKELPDEEITEGSLSATDNIHVQSEANTSADNLAQNEELVHKLMLEDEKRLEEKLECQRHIENEAKQKVLMKQSRIDMGMAQKNVVEEQSSVVSDLNIDLAQPHCSSYSSTQAVTAVPTLPQGSICSDTQEGVMPGHTQPQESVDSAPLVMTTDPTMLHLDSFDYQNQAPKALRSTQDFSKGIVFGSFKPVPILSSTSELLDPFRSPQSTHSAQSEDKTDTVEHGMPINEPTSDRSIEKDKLGTGLKNAAGENNCFLNVVLQSLWHLRRFWQDFRRISKPSLHKCVGDPCIVCALHDVFTDLSKAPEVNSDVVDPKRLRVALGLLAANDNFLQEGQTNDASEVLDLIFKCLHLAVTSPTELDTESARTMLNMDWGECASNNCMAHRVFGTSKYLGDASLGTRQFKSSSFFLYVNVTVLLEMKATHAGSSFHELLRLMEMETESEYVHKSLCILPHISTIVLCWQSANESLNVISATLAAISTSLDIGRIYFDSAPGNIHILVSVVCYGGGHDLCFIYRIKHGAWFLYNDETVKVIGNWDDVLDFCRKERLQPQILFYECILCSESIPSLEDLDKLLS